MQSHPGDQHYVRRETNKHTHTRGLFYASSHPRIQGSWPKLSDEISFQFWHMKNGTRMQKPNEHKTLICNVDEI